MTTPRRVRITGSLFRQEVPEGAVRVTRPTRWGNPHLLSKPGKGKPCRLCGVAHHDRDEVIDLYHEFLRQNPELVAAARRDLAGKDLACWCSPDERCHADVLLAVAGGEQP
jgi:Domain of unknown function (DUF4326)